MACCPFGPLFSVPATFVSVAFILAWITAFSCHFFSSFGTSVSEPVNFGLWTVEDLRSTRWGISTADDFYDDDYWNQNACLLYTETIAGVDALDGPLVFGRVMSMIVASAAIVVWIIVMIASCVAYPRPFMMCMGITMITLGIGSILCLVALASDFCGNDCSLEYAGILAIVGFFLWISSGVIFFLLKAKEPAKPPVINQPGVTEIPPEAPAEVETVEERTENPDGTTSVKTTTTTTNPDGSKTVTESTTIEAAGGPTTSATPY